MIQQRKAEQKRQEWLVVIIGIGIILASIVTTLWFSGVIGNKQPVARYQNVTFTDALVMCEKQVRGAYQGRLRVLTFDDHSSRFDPDYYLYRMFFNAVMSSDTNESGTGEFFINCYISADKGQVAKFEAYEKRESQTEAIRRDSGGMFGWPLKRL